MNSTLGSVVPLAMFHLDDLTTWRSSMTCWVRAQSLLRGYGRGKSFWRSLRLSTWHMTRVKTKTSFLECTQKDCKHDFWIHNRVSIWPRKRQSPFPRFPALCWRRWSGQARALWETLHQRFCDPCQVCPQQENENVSSCWGRTSEASELFPRAGRECEEKSHDCLGGKAEEEWLPWDSAPSGHHRGCEKVQKDVWWWGWRCPANPSSQELAQGCPQAGKGEEGHHLAPDRC